MSRLGDSSDHKSAEGEGTRSPLDVGDRQIARPGWLKNGNKPGNPHECLRCGAKTRKGTLCRAPAMPNGRCRMHGGASTGPRSPEGRAKCGLSNLKHGRFTREAKQRRQELRAFVKFEVAELHSMEREVRQFLKGLPPITRP